MLSLAIHTSSPELGLALGADGVLIKHQVWPLGRDLSAHIHGYLQDFLAPHSWQELEQLAVAIGPGGFTGTRIGVVVARTLAQQLGIPLFGISSLAAIATAQPASPTPQIAVQMRAQRKEVFGAIYEHTPAGLQPRLPDQVWTLADWQQTLADWPTAYQLAVAEAGLASTVKQVWELAQQQWQAGQRPPWQTVLPYYGQHPVKLD